MPSKYYAVRVGRKTGIFRTWDECKRQVDGFSGAVFKSFTNMAEAEAFRQQPISSRGNGGGVYTNRAKRLNNGSYYTRSHAHSGSHAYIRKPLRTFAKGYHSNIACLPQPSLPVVYSDGCCFNNGRTGASAGVGVYWSDGSKWNVSERLEGPQTNQRAELVSACRAIESAISQCHHSIELCTDSSYTIKCVTEWIHKWEREGWLTVNGDPVKNQTDIMRLYELCKRVRVEWRHVPGHQGIHGNEMADMLAKAGSEK